MVDTLILLLIRLAPRSLILSLSLSKLVSAICGASSCVLVCV